MGGAYGTYVEDVGLDARNAGGEEESSNASGATEETETEGTVYVSNVHIILK